MSTRTSNRNRLDEIVVKITRKQKPSRIWAPCNIMKGAKIGKGTNIGCFTEVGPNVTIGRNCRIGKGCFIPEGVTIEDNVFVGPHVTMMNDILPPSPKAHWLKTVIREGAVIGAACAILPGVTVGKGTMLGAGSVLTKSTGNNELWYGNPARRQGLL